MINKLQLIQLNGDITSITLYYSGGKTRHLCLLEILDVAKIPPVCNINSIEYYGLQVAINTSAQNNGGSLTS